MLCNHYGYFTKQHNLLNYTTNTYILARYVQLRGTVYFLYLDSLQSYIIMVPHAPQ